MMHALLSVRHLFRFLFWVTPLPFFALASSAAQAPDVWMSSGPRVANPAPGWEGLRTDAGDMWKPDAPWQTVARGVKVIQLAPTNVERARDGDLQQALSDIKRRNLALALEASLLVRTDQCRSNTEAYSDPGATEKLLEKIQRLGGDLKFIIMDEPFYYGH